MSTERPEIRLVLADVDGTLVTSEKILTPQAIAAVGKLRERGILFAVTSGRPPKGMAMLVEPLAIDQPIAGFNGGLMVRPDWSVIQSRTIEPETVKKAVGVMREHDVDVWIYAGNDWFIPDADHPHVAREQWTVKFQPTIRDDIDSITENVVKITAVSDDKERMKKLEAAMKETVGDSASAALSQPYYLDVTHPEANKGGVVHTLSKMLDIPTAQIATFGDQPNDVLMFKAGGVSVVMGQARDDVKAQADYVSTSCDEEGFALGVERFILGEA